MLRPAKTTGRREKETKTEEQWGEAERIGEPGKELGKAQEQGPGLRTART